MEASKSGYRETSIEEIDRIYAVQSLAVIENARHKAKVRRKKLTRLLNSVLDRQEEIRQAIYDDCRRHPSEVDMTEIYPVVSEIRHTRKELHRWMRTQKQYTPMALAGATSMTKAEPKGHVLIISPWNFPVNLTLAPLVSAIAAGNTVILKPSEFTPNTNRVLRIIVEDVFEESEVYLVEGAVETTQHILDKKFNHIFFTGSPAVGKIVMRAASEYLSSVTLELGGKSPTIIDESANIDTAAKRIAWGKFVNNGQICIAPDYILVHKQVEEKFTKALSSYLDSFYPDPRSDKSYSRIINAKNFDRLNSYLEDARNKGAKISYGGESDRSELYIAPTLLSDVPENADVLKEEIFGPLLPIQTFSKTEEVLKLINGRPKPLALYVYARNRKFIEQIHNGTRAGATCVNHNAVHFYNTHLPFGGVNNSGIGKAHGQAGFMEFSNNRAVFRQNIPNALELLVPPYNSFKQKLIDITLKYL